MISSLRRRHHRSIGATSSEMDLARLWAATNSGVGTAAIRSAQGGTRPGVTVWWQRHDVVGVGFVGEFSDDPAEHGDPVLELGVGGLQELDAVVGVSQLLPQPGDGVGFQK